MRSAPFLLAGVLAAGDAFAQSPATLSASTQLPASGANLDLHVSGPSGASFLLLAALAPAEVDLHWGRLFLEPTALVVLASGTLDPGGLAILSFTVPSDPALRDFLIHLQALTKAGKAKALSNALAIRIEPSPPSGARQPASVAVTPDGARAFVVHDDDGTVTAIDPVADVVVRDFPIALRPATLERPPQIAVDPEGRHAFVVAPASRRMTVIDTATDSISAQVAVPLGCSGIAFEFGATSDRVFVGSARDQAVLVFTETPAGVFSHTATLPLRGAIPAVLALLPDGNLLVGQHNTLEIEVIDPDDADGDPFVQRIPLGSRPLDFAISGDHLFVPTFTPSPVTGSDGVNEVIDFDLDTLVENGRWFQDRGTDYFSAAASDQLLLLAASGSGTLLVADAAGFTFAVTVDLQPGLPIPGVPEDVALVPAPGGGAADRAYVIDRFRETVRPVQLAGGPPFTLATEIPLAWSGAVRDPLVDLDQVEKGELLFSSVHFFNGTPALPNPVSCNTCHPRLFSDSITTAFGRQCQPLFSIASLAPFGWKGDQLSLNDFTMTAFTTHNRLPGTLDPQKLADVVAFQDSVTAAPASPFLAEDGSTSEAAQRGKSLFEGAASCSVCHTAPLFVPAPPIPPTIKNGVGTGIAPANVATLLGAWATAPYLHDGSAPTLLDVLLNNVADQHGTTSTLTAQELADLVEYLKTL